MATKRIEVARPEPQLIELVMTHEQAGTLVSVLGLVGGNPDMSARKYIDDVLEALEAAGIRRVGHVRSNSCVWFENDTEGR